MASVLGQNSDFIIRLELAGGGSRIIDVGCWLSGLLRFTSGEPPTDLLTFLVRRASTYNCATIFKKNHIGSRKVCSVGEREGMGAIRPQILSGDK